jgi:hypothetical protein
MQAVGADHQIEGALASVFEADLHMVRSVL